MVFRFGNRRDALVRRGGQASTGPHVTSVKWTTDAVRCAKAVGEQWSDTGSGYLTLVTSEIHVLQLQQTRTLPPLPAKQNPTHRTVPCEGCLK